MTRGDIGDLHVLTPSCCGAVMLPDARGLSLHPQKIMEALFAGMDNAVLDRIARILSYVRTTADGKRLKRRDRDALLVRPEDAGRGPWG